ncbi:DNA-binding response regulator [Intestinirhabdus alba]|nr:DNA-binding response regulator [Intestinirhabdus alba]
MFADNPDISFTLTDDYYKLIDILQKNASEEKNIWIFCDVDSLPRERFRALHLMKEFYRYEHKKLIMLLSEHNMPLFFALYSLLPNAHWLLKTEDVENIQPFLKQLLSTGHNISCFSHSLVDYARHKLRNGQVNYTLSGNEWWLMEEILKGKSLSQISCEVNVDVRRLSYIKRHLMKRLNIRNNIALFDAFKGIFP